MAKQTETPPPNEPEKISIFERHRIKYALVNRMFRALKDAPDDAMRNEMIAEVSSLTKLIGANG